MVGLKPKFKWSAGAWRERFISAEIHMPQLRACCRRAAHEIATAQIYCPELRALSNVCWLGQPERHTPKLRDCWEQCSDVTGSTCLILGNKSHKHVQINIYTAAQQEQVLHWMPQRLWQDHPPSSAGSKHTEPTSPLLISILVSFLQYFLNQYFSENPYAPWI